MLEFFEYLLYVNQPVRTKDLNPPYDLQTMSQTKLVKIHFVSNDMTPQQKSNLSITWFNRTEPAGDAIIFTTTEENPKVLRYSTNDTGVTVFGYTGFLTVQFSPPQIIDEAIGWGFIGSKAEGKIKEKDQSQKIVHGQR